MEAESTFILISWPLSYLCQQAGRLLNTKHKVRLNALKNNRNSTTLSKFFIGQEGWSQSRQELGFKINAAQKKIQIYKGNIESCWCSRKEHLKIIKIIKDQEEWIKKKSS